jgi:hypothetical protein
MDKAQKYSDSESTHMVEPYACLDLITVLVYQLL